MAQHGALALPCGAALASALGPHLAAACHGAECSWDVTHGKTMGKPWENGGLMGLTGGLMMFMEV